MKKKIIVCVMLAAFLVLGLCGCREVSYTRKDDTAFVILQISDLHLKDNSSYQGRAFKTVRDMINGVKPDMVVVTGDLTSEDDSVGVIKKFGEFMEGFATPWYYTFGNHDPEGDYTKKEIGDALESFEYCRYENGDEEVFGYGNAYYNIEFDGKVIETVFFFDTSGVTGGVAPFDETQIEWYEKSVKEIENQEGKLVPSIAFCHIPMREYQTAYNEALSKGEVLYGGKGEEECPADEDDEMFEKMLELGSTKGVFCGHEHLNNYVVNYRGIRLSYVETCDHKLYIPTRGGDVINVKKDGSFTQQKLSRKKSSAKYVLSEEF